MVYSISAVIACYGDELAIPIMYERLTNCLTKINVDYELIFVNDGSPDGCEEVIRELSLNDQRVFGVSHSRNFGSQSAFLSGMKMARKNSVVLLDGDLQDPPECIPRLLDALREGAEIAIGSGSNWSSGFMPAAPPNCPRVAREAARRRCNFSSPPPVTAIV